MSLIPKNWNKNKPPWKYCKDCPYRFNIKSVVDFVKLDKTDQEAVEKWARILEKNKDESTT